jgi:hypothetical protein
VNGLTTGLHRRVDDFSSNQVGFCGRRFSDEYRLVCFLNMKASGVCLGIYRNSPDLQSFAGSDDPNSNLSTIGNQYFLKHHQPLLTKEYCRVFDPACGFFCFPEIEGSE